MFRCSSLADDMFPEAFGSISRVHLGKKLMGSVWKGEANLGRRLLRLLIGASGDIRVISPPLCARVVVLREKPPFNSTGVFMLFSCESESVNEFV